MYKNYRPAWAAFYQVSTCTTQHTQRQSVVVHTHTSFVCEPKPSCHCWRGKRFDVLSQAVQQILRSAHDSN